MSESKALCTFLQRIPISRPLPSVKFCFLKVFCQPISKNLKKLSDKDIESRKPTDQGCGSPDEHLGWHTSSHLIFHTLACCFPDASSLELKSIFCSSCLETRVISQENLVTQRHRHNLQTVDGKILQKEFIVASPQQQQVISSFTVSSTKRHLVLEGPAGTGKTLVAVQVANNLMESAKNGS